MIRDRKLRTEDGTVVVESEDLDRAENEGYPVVPCTTWDRHISDAEKIEQLQAEVTMLRERLTRWAKVITKMYEQVTREILF